MIINTLYKTDTLIDGIKYNPPSEINNYGYSIELIWKNENNELHNENSLAYIRYNENGNISYKQWYVNGKLHNDNGPAVILYDKDGNITKQEYWENGNITKQQYWKNGIRIK